MVAYPLQKFGYLPELVWRPGAEKNLDGIYKGMSKYIWNSIRMWATASFFAEIESSEVALPGRFVGLCRFTDFFQQNDVKHKDRNGWEWCGYPYPRKEIVPNMPHVCEQPPSTVGQWDPSCAKLLSNTEKQGWNHVGDLLSICLCFLILCEICIGLYRIVLYVSVCTLHLPVLKISQSTLYTFIL